MILTLQEVMDCCSSWERFCRLHGVSEWAVNEGGGDVKVSLTTHQAHHLGIVRLTDWKVRPVEEVYPPGGRCSPFEDSVEDHESFA